MLRKQSPWFLKNNNNSPIEVTVSYRALMVDWKALQKRSTIWQTSGAQHARMCLLDLCLLHFACQARFGTSLPSLGSSGSIHIVGFCPSVTAHSIHPIFWRSAERPLRVYFLRAALLRTRSPSRVARIPHACFLQGQTSKYRACASQVLVSMFPAVFFSSADFVICAARKQTKGKRNREREAPATEMLLE